MKRILWIVLLAVTSFAIAVAEEPSDSAVQPNGSSAESAEVSMVIPPGAKIYVAPMPNSFDEYLKTAFTAKKVPVEVVEAREQAEFEITGTAESEKASTAKKLIMGSWHSKESASIKVANLKSGVIAYGYSYHTSDSAHGKKSSAESCAKHLKEKIESRK